MKKSTQKTIVKAIVGMIVLAFVASIILPALLR